MLLVFSFLLYFTIQQDNSSGQPADNMLRAKATIIEPPSSHTTSRDGFKDEYYYNVRIRVELDNNEVHIVNLSDQIPRSVAGSLDTGSEIKVKYLNENHEVYWFANDPPPVHRVALYVIFGVLIIASGVGIAVSSRKIDARAHHRKMEENMRRAKEVNGMNDPEKNNPYSQLDGSEPSAGLNPFSGDNSIDYNARYQQDQSLNDTSQEYSPFGGAADLNSPFGGAADLNSPFGGAADLNSPFGGAADLNSPSDDTSVSADTSYGAPNPSMDAKYDPFAPYSGYQQ